MSKEALLNQADVSLLIGVSEGTIGEDFKRPPRMSDGFNSAVPLVIVI